MSRLYWMSSMIASTSGEDISFSPNAISGLSSNQVSAAIREVASNKTGVKMSRSIGAGTTSFSFTNSYFTNEMYVDYYSSDKVELDGWPIYNDSTKTITFNCKSVPNTCTFRIVAQF